MTLGAQMCAFEQDVTIGSRRWPELAELEANGYAGWVPIFDAEMRPVALVPRASAAVICEVLNRFKPDEPVDYDENNEPVWEAPMLETDIPQHHEH